MKKYVVFFGFFCVLLGASMVAAKQPASKVFSTKSYIVNKEFKSIIKIDLLGNKVYLNAKVNGKKFRFILDTGSPTLLTKKVAEELSLEIKGTNTGKDANGNLVKMDLSILERLEIGNVEFRNIPVFIFDTSNLELGDSIFDGGVIGSEIMPLSNWQINFNKKELILTDDLTKLEFIDGAHLAPLKVYNYPYTPIIEYRIHDTFKDHAIFDTGSSELVQLYDPAFLEIKKLKLVQSEISKAFGTFGESGGGRGSDTTFHLVELKKFSIGDLFLNNIKVWTRPEAPTLFGAKILESHVVTLDYKNKRVYFYKYQEPKKMEISFGFKVYLKKQSVYIGFLEEPSPATNAGLQLHDQIIKINDLVLTSPAASEQLETLKKISLFQKNQEIKVTYKRNEIEKIVLLKKE